MAAANALEAAFECIGFGGIDGRGLGDAGAADSTEGRVTNPLARLHAACWAPASPWCAQQATLANLLVANSALAPSMRLAAARFSQRVLRT